MDILVDIALWLGVVLWVLFGVGVALRGWIADLDRNRRPSGRMR
jgi:hypothetical protein